ncbi:MAG: MogA/MoaB family molybdenum cofactor biosynthesis protein [Candidatus Asgardarchaeia archaeon]
MDEDKGNKGKKERKNRGMTESGMHPPKHHISLKRDEIRFALITVSDSRYEKMVRGEDVQDLTAEVVSKILEREGHKLVFYEVVPDDLLKIREAALRAIDRDSPDVLILSGGTGITKSDVTVEAISPLLSKRLTGFEVIFHLKSYEKVGNATILSRSIAGLCKRTLVFVLPGSPNAVSLALNEIIIPEIKHLVSMALS